MTTQTTPPVVLSEQERIECDLAIHRWKQSNGPARDNDRRALELQIQHADAVRLGGMS